MTNSASTNTLAEVNFDGLIGPTHSHAGLSPGNLASAAHAGQAANPKQAALQGLAKMRFMVGLGLPQAVLPPHERPNLRALRKLGIGGSDAEVLRAAGQSQLLQVVSSASAMWTANAATVVPSTDSVDGLVHIAVANLTNFFHRNLESETTTRILRKIFVDPARFQVHDSLPGGSQFADEGATSNGPLHLWAWGRRAWGQAPLPRRHAARQTFEASAAIARLSQVEPSHYLLWQQDPAGIDAGAFHTDVLAVGHRHLFLFHEHALVEPDQLELELRTRLGSELILRRVRETELPVQDAVAAYPFNSQLVTLPSGEMALVAPIEAENNPRCRDLLGRLITEGTPLRQIFYRDVTGSMQNGGGPACLRLRVPLLESERRALGARVLLNLEAIDQLEVWVERHYRDRLRLVDLADPELLNEGRTALDELSQLLGLGSVYDFQR
jgi:succinylarginine dihydrolase